MNHNDVEFDPESAGTLAVILSAPKAAILAPHSASSASSSFQSSFVGHSSSAAESSHSISSYLDLLQASYSAHLLPIEASQVLKLCGKDGGRPLALISGAALPHDDAGRHNFLLYLIKTLDPIVEAGEYSVIYLHTDGLSPPILWLRQVLSILPRKYRKNLKRLFVVHPTVIMRALLAALSPFLSEKVWNKIVYCHLIDEIEQYGLSRQQLEPLSDSDAKLDLELSRKPSVWDDFVDMMKSSALSTSMSMGSAFGMLMPPTSLMEQSYSSYQSENDADGRHR